MITDVEMRRIADLIAAAGFYKPRLLVIREEVGRLELEFQLLSDRGLGPKPLAAIATVFGGEVSADEPEDGCESCSWGARQIVTVTGGKLPP